MRPALAVLAAAVLLLAGCGQTSPSNSLTPMATGVPTAVTYASPAALYRAIQAAGSPRVEGMKVSTPFSSHMRARAHAQKGALVAPAVQGSWAMADGEPATIVTVALFPDAASTTVGLASGGWMAKALGWPWIWQLRGPNWLLWSIEQDTMQSLQRAIGGSLTRASATSSEPTPFV